MNPFKTVDKRLHATATPRDQERRVLELTAENSKLRAEVVKLQRHLKTILGKMHKLLREMEK